MSDMNTPDLQDLPAAALTAFHMMWDLFPEPVTLVHKSRAVAASNPAAMEQGRTPGMICSRIGAPELHKGCLGNKALELRTAQVSRISLAGGSRLVYWLPVPGLADYYIHFSVGISDAQ